MKTIWKFDIGTTDLQFISMPKDAKILCVHTQFGRPQIWALVDPDNITEKKTIKTYGTGHPIDEEDIKYLKYIGTYLIHNDSLVFHVFEQI